MTSTQTRNKTYQDILESLPKKRSAVFESILSAGFASIEDVCDDLSLQKNEVSGRITELKSLYLIKEIGNNKTKKNHTQTVYSAVEQSERRWLMTNDLHEQKRREENLVFNLTLVTGFTKELVFTELKKVESKIKQIEKLLN